MAKIVTVVDDDIRVVKYISSFQGVTVRKHYSNPYTLMNEFLEGEAEPEKSETYLIDCSYGTVMSTQDCELFSDMEDALRMAGIEKYFYMSALRYNQLGPFIPPKGRFIHKSELQNLFSKP